VFKKSFAEEEQKENLAGGSISGVNFCWLNNTQIYNLLLILQISINLCLNPILTLFFKV